MASSRRRRWPTAIKAAAPKPPSRRVALLPGTSLSDPTYSRVLTELARALRARGWQARAFCPRRHPVSALARFRPSLVNVHFSGHLGARARRWAEGGACVLTFQDLDHPDMPPLAPRQLEAVSGLVARARAVVALTPELARRLRRRHGARGVAVIGNGVSPIWFDARARARRGPIVCIARLAPYKGIDLLLWAFADLARADPRARLAIYGADFQNGRYQGLAEALGLGARVRFAGNVGTSRLRRALRRAPLLVSASRSETYGMALLEAMASGTPVLATRAGAAASLISHGRTGWLVPAGDPAALSLALGRLWSDAALRRRLGEAGRAAAARHGWTGRAALYDEIFRRTLNGR